MAAKLRFIIAREQPPRVAMVGRQMRTEPILEKITNYGRFLAHDPGRRRRRATSR